MNEDVVLLKVFSLGIIVAVTVVSVAIWYVYGLNKRSRLSIDEDVVIRIIGNTFRYAEKSIPRGRQAGDGFNLLDIEPRYSALIPCLSDASLKELLAEEDSSAGSFVRFTDMVVSASHYPSRPLYKEFARVLCSWVRQGRFPLVFERFGHLSSLDSTEKEVEHLESLTDAVLSWGHYVSSDDLSAVAVRTETASLIAQFGMSGILLCLRVRRTRGSIETLPPSPGRLIAAANLSNDGSPGDETRMTAAHIAFAKHAHRSQDEWWGTVKGNTLEKNRKAEEIVIRLLNEAAWVNMHYLPHDTAVVEVRCLDGFGARWYANGSRFRGFLEPHVPGGHEVRWRH